MGEESPKPASTPTGAVFLSYASQDAEAAQRICAALRSAGVEVWFDKSELRGGDAWDQSIRKQIKTCALFVPIISQHTHERAEGYFRLEWKLAVDRSHLIMANKAFLVPVSIDDTADDDENVPEKFREVQWTRLPGGATQPEFAARIKRLLSPDPPISARLCAGAAPGSSPVPLTTRTPSTLRRAVPIAVAVLFLAALGYLHINKLWLSKPTVPGVTSNSISSPAPASAFAPPPHSIAVLPFVDLSEKHDQEYFADGMAEELLDLLAQVPDLRVPARTSSFYFKGKSVDLGSIAQKLRVAHLLEGSVRKAGNTIRVTVQLIRAEDGYHLWSKTYDRDFQDTFKVQDSIASAIVSALKVTLDPAHGISNTHRSSSLEAYRLYLLGKQLFEHPNKENMTRAGAAYQEALLLDPEFAAAHAGLAAVEFELGGETRASALRALDEADKAVALEAGLAEAHSTRGILRFASWDWKGSQTDFERANELDPNDSVGLRRYGELLGSIGRLEEAIAVERRAVDLDPLSVWAWNHLARYQIATGQFEAARDSAQHALQIEPNNGAAIDYLGTATLLSGDGLAALTAFGQHKVGSPIRLRGLALAQYTIGQLQASRESLDQLVANFARDSAFGIAEVYAWRGEKDQAFEWLYRAYGQSGVDLCYIKANPLLGSLHRDPRYRALLRKMNLPE
jgi:TolB-like protein